MEPPDHQTPSVSQRPRALSIAGWLVVGLGALGGSLSAAFALTRTNQPVDPSLPEGVAEPPSGLLSRRGALSVGRARAGVPTRGRTKGR